MPVYDEDEKGLENTIIDNAVKGPLFPPKKEKPEKPRRGPGGLSFLKNIPVLKIVGIAVVLLVVMAIFSLAAKMSSISEELKQLQAQLSTIQGSVTSKIESTGKERDKMKAAIEDLKQDIDSMKAHQRHLAEEAANQRKAAAEAAKKNDAKKKTTVVAAAKKTQRQGKREKAPAGQVIKYEKGRLPIRPFCYFHRSA